MGIDSAGMASGPDPEPSSAGGPHSRDRSRSPRAAECVQGQTQDMVLKAAETKEFQKTRDQSAKEVMILELEIQARAANAELEAERLLR